MANWLDSMIAWVSPKRGAERLAWRSAYEEFKSYDAGDGSRLNHNWRVSNMSAEMTDAPSRDIIRARARDMERNSDFMNAITSAFRRNIIGSGFQLQAMTSKESLNEELEKLWRKWCKARNCDITGTQSLNQMLRMAVDRKKIDGGVLFVKVMGGGGMLPFKLQMIEVDELDCSKSYLNKGKNRTLGGIEYNEYNKPVGYWIKQYEIDGSTMTEPRYVKANDVIFYYTKHRPSQIREISDMSQTLSRIRDANEFMTAVSVKERVEACLSVFIKRQYPMQGLGRSNVVQEGPRKTYEGRTLTPGMIQELNVGDDVQVVNPSGQSADATNYIKLQQRLIGAGQGISYEAMSRDMSQTNYSSARQGSIEDELTFVEEEEQIISILDEIYETFVISCVVNGLVKIADFWDKKDEYFSHEWIKQPKKWIDPQKESSATKTALNTGQKTYKQIAAEGGRDWRRQIDDMAEVLEYAQSKGIDFGGVMFDGKLQAAQKAAETEPADPAAGGDEQDGTGDSQNDGSTDEEPANDTGSEAGSE